MAKQRKTGKTKELEKKHGDMDFSHKQKKKAAKKGVQRTKSKPKRELLGKRYTIYK